ncbi:hypothetical protein MSIMFI_05546 [Mycobacterium simulans]|nr:hypothetical protein MSIMFI_05546 [Mycobacterium simulans]
MVGGQFPVVRQQLWIGVERAVEPVPCVFVGFGSHQTDQGAVDLTHPLQPFQRQVAPEKSGGARQQYRLHFGANRGQLGCGRQRRGVDELVQCEVASVHLEGIFPT